MVMGVASGQGGCRKSPAPHPELPHDEETFLRALGSSDRLVQDARILGTQSGCGPMVAGNYLDPGPAALRRPERSEKRL
jgi:hypothetical protein